MDDRRRARRGSGRRSAFLIALSLHVLVIGALFLGLEWRSVHRPAHAPTQTIVEAKVVDEAVLKALDEARRRKAEAEKRRREEAARKKAEAEKRRREEAARKKAEAEKRRREEAARKKAEAEKRRREKAAAEKRRREELARQAAQERALEEQLLLEEQQREERRLAADRQRKIRSLIDHTIALIQQKVERNWIRPPQSAKGLSCRVLVRLMPGGLVVGVRLQQSSGDELFDRSVVNAVHKASPLPLPDEPGIFDYFRELEFVFKPEG